MGSHCCSEKKFEGVSVRYKRVLWVVIALNAIMFGVEMTAGLFAQSQALQADALDFLADSVTYALSLWVIGKSIRMRTTVAIGKGLSLSFIGAWVLLSTIYQMTGVHSPEPVTMSWVAAAALGVNILSVILLISYKDGDANVRSVWLCSRNDAIGNVAVILAASGVWATQSGWPDLIVAFFMATLFFSSSLQIIRQALAERREALLHNTM
ncbi:cation transporter [Alkalimarinus alittae]|uniref:Cation transporter n=1 Tax=Alkalimarinus alittae TaxID=2961619 RepID=A0ABY6N273_9ALTE|nr:cation transporter [Alkalimarinus alittae]UZE96181.1 cation transporter [Alkalimarinus alittae]